MYEKIERKFTQRATPAEGGKRNRRITLTFTPALADRLGILARADGVSINHAAEMLVEAEYTRRLKDKDAAKLIEALERLTQTTVEIKGDDGKTVYKGAMLTAKIDKGTK